MARFALVLADLGNIRIEDEIRFTHEPLA